MAVIMRTSSIIFSLILLLAASVTGKVVYAQERIRIATAGGLSIVPVWVMQDKGLLTKRGVTAESCKSPRARWRFKPCSRGRTKPS